MGPTPLGTGEQKEHIFFFIQSLKSPRTFPGLFVSGLQPISMITQPFLKSDSFKISWVPVAVKIMSAFLAQFFIYSMLLFLSTMLTCGDCFVRKLQRGSPTSLPFPIISIILSMIWISLDCSILITAQTTQGIKQDSCPFFQNSSLLTTPRQSTSLSGLIIPKNQSSLSPSNPGKGSCKRIPLYLGSPFNLPNKASIFYYASSVCRWKSRVRMLALFAQSFFLRMQERDAGWSPTRIIARRGWDIAVGSQGIFY